MSHLNQLLFGYYPYIALTVFLLGSLFRFDREQYTWRSGSSQMLRKERMVLASNLFHVGILGLLVGHTVGLLTPIAVFDAFGIGHGAKQVLAIVAGGVFGLMCFAGLTMLVRRRLTDPRIRNTSSRMDIAILLMLYAQLILGLITIPFSIAHADGETMVKFMEWAQHIVTFRPGAAELIADVPAVFKLHLVLGLTIFLVFPFSRLVHVWSVPFAYVGRQYQIVRTR
ncbi:respiratory nitrate reductase subunit gamma [Skermanella mucosa]|uniref:respiratory nitrate reductase subunit gamma n=1 Tax=Skermanella mucosa TaxID=1789672 RepID=UPI00192C3A06|nr:respiratory nitrate reductase subunit gamma [Skermanella mucosa]UEM18513.1 respiratory nitrate reductase subunit gamma [Skermanella mucosa]